MPKQIDWKRRAELIKAQKEKLKERAKFRQKQLKLNAQAFKERLGSKFKLKKEKLKAKSQIVPVSQLHKTLWKITSSIVRKSSEYCFTCGKRLEYKDRNAGHYWTQGSHGAARYEFDNLRVQCTGCNNWKSGNLAEYSLKLRPEIGDERFEKLALLAHSTRKYSRDELEKMIYSRKISLEIIEQNE